MSEYQSDGFGPELSGDQTERRGGKILVSLVMIVGFVIFIAFVFVVVPILVVLVVCGGAFLSMVTAVFSLLLYSLISNLSEVNNG